MISCSGQKQVSVQADDGDTLVISQDEMPSANGSRKSDLAYIDAPEREQPYGRESKALLNQLVSDFQGPFEEQGNGIVIVVDGNEINLQMVREGAAWVSRSIEDPLVAARYMEAQEDAQFHLRGLWGLGHGLRVPPWVWRKQGKEPMRRPPNPAQRPPSYSASPSANQPQYQRPPQQSNKPPVRSPRPDHSKKKNDESNN